MVAERFSGGRALLQAQTMLHMFRAAVLRRARESLEMDATMLVLMAITARKLRDGMWDGSITHIFNRDVVSLTGKTS